MTFAAITVALVLGAIVDRMKFSSWIVFTLLWVTFIYCPIAHWVWGGGWMGEMGALDFAGGNVVHINAGVAGLVLALVLGKRIGYGKEAMFPSSITLTALGAALLWFGWFGFNAGSQLAADGVAGSAFLVTNTSARHGGLCVDVRGMDGPPRNRRFWACLRQSWPAWWPSPRPPGSSTCPPRWSSVWWPVCSAFQRGDPEASSPAWGMMIPWTPSAFTACAAMGRLATGILPIRRSTPPARPALRQPQATRIQAGLHRRHGGLHGAGTLIVVYPRPRLLTAGCGWSRRLEIQGWTAPSTGKERLKFRS
jgi:hypothetical protein